MIRGIVCPGVESTLRTEEGDWAGSGEGWSLLVHEPGAAMAQRAPIVGLAARQIDRSEHARCVGTARLDDFQGVARQLMPELRKEESFRIGDLFALAVERWGENAAAHLHGEFSFAVWDSRSRSLLLCRDRHGVHPLYYRELKGRVAFASRIQDLCSLPCDVPELDPAGLAMALSGRFGCKETTPYKSIHRVPPGHWVRIDSEGKRIEAYWQLDPEKEIRLGSDQEYAERLRELFVNAVRTRIDAPTRIGAALSGGMDSSSICGVAAHLLREQGREPLAAFSAMLSPDSPFSEGKFIRAVVNESGLDFHPFDLEGLSPTSGLDQILHAIGAPYPPGNMFIPDIAYGMAHKLGIGIYMDGYDGDNAIGHGFDMLPHLARNRRWLRLYKEVRALHRRGGIYGHHAMKWKPRQWMAYYIWNSWLASSFPIRAARGAGSRAKRLLGGRKSAKAPTPSFVRPQPLEEYSERQRRWRPPFDPRNSPAHYHASVITAGQQVWLLELTAALADSHGIEVRLPFFDTKLIEFCVGIPVEQKLRDGMSRWVMRNAMKGYLPDSVRLRPHKSNYEVNFAEALRRDELPRIKKLLLQTDLGLDALVNMDRLRSLVAVLEEGKLMGSDLSALYRTFVLAVWLEMSESRVPPSPPA